MKIEKFWRLKMYSYVTYLCSNIKIQMYSIFCKKLHEIYFRNLMRLDFELVLCCSQQKNCSAVFYKKLGIYCERTEPYVLFEVLSIACLSNRLNFWYFHMMWSATQTGHASSIEISGKHKEQCLVNTGGGVKLPTWVFPNRLFLEYSTQSH